MLPQSDFRFLENSSSSSSSVDDQFRLRDFKPEIDTPVRYLYVSTAKCEGPTNQSPQAQPTEDVGLAGRPHQVSRLVRLRRA